MNRHGSGKPDTVDEAISRDSAAIEELRITCSGCHSTNKQRRSWVEVYCFGLSAFQYQLSFCCFCFGTKRQIGNSRRYGKNVEPVHRCYRGRSQRKAGVWRSGNQQFGRTRPRTFRTGYRRPFVALVADTHRIAQETTSATSARTYSPQCPLWGH